VDTDERIEAAAGRTIREIFEREGEESFRVAETDVVERVVRDSRQVIAAGGGVVLAARNRAALRAAGVCVWLTAPAAELQGRIEGDPRTKGTRPALTELGGISEVRRLLTQRRPLYAALAQHVVQTRARPVAEVVEAVLSVLARDDGLRPDTP
jgi:shikimate kinase